MLSKTQYYTEDVYRMIKDYEHSYKSFVKRRWIGKQIFEMFSTEFLTLTPEYYKEAILTGKIVVNKQPVDLTYVLKEHDCIEHKTIGREPSTLNLPIEIIDSNEEFIIICKPPSIPVHGCGNFRFNTVLGIMKQEMGYKDIFPLHRLDKLTSGLLLISKSQTVATKFQQELLNHNIKKIYIARVVGKFLPDVLEVTKPIYCVSKKLGRYDVCDDDEKELKEAKDAKTIFKKIWYDEITNTSLVECHPITGKTHQLRVHLKSLGHPIINDRNYGGPFIGNKIEELMRKGLSIYASNPIYEPLTEKIGMESKAGEVDPKESTEQKVEATQNIEKADSEKEEMKNESREVSNKKEGKNDAATADEKSEAFYDEEGESGYIREIWLHSVLYKYKEEVFRAKLPYWADKSFTF